MPAQAQRPAGWKIYGDTTGAPPWCSAAAAIGVINLLLKAIRNADVEAMRRALAPKFVFSIIPFTPTDSFFIARSPTGVARYAKELQLHHEHMVMQAIFFNRWRGQALEFGPVYWLRSGDNGKSSRTGIGKGEYLCGKGISVLNLAPRPVYDAGPQSYRQRR